MTRADLIKQIGANIRAAREAKGWTQQQLADACQMLVPAVSRLEGGRVEMKVWTLWQVARALGVRVADLDPEPK